MLAVTWGKGSLYAGMQLVWFAGQILSVVMLRSELFSKATAWAGILGLGLLVAGIISGGHYTSTGETAAVQSIFVAVPHITGGLLLLEWYILVGMRLLEI